ncbi:hypothetical protein FQZ97_861970 [compost metagenome]
MVLDHLRRHAHQRQRVLVVAAVVTGHVERADDLAVGIEDGRGRTGEELVGVHVVLAAVHGERFLFTQRGADRVGALALLRPVHAGRERHLRSALQKIHVAQRVQHETLGRGQQHHAVGVDDLVVERLHHGCGVLEQEAVFFQRVGQHAMRRAREVGLVGHGDAVRLRAAVRLVDQLVEFGGDHARWRGFNPTTRDGAREEGRTHVVSRVRGNDAPVVHRPACVVCRRGGGSSVFAVLVAHAIFFITVSGNNTGYPGVQQPRPDVPVPG